MSLTTTSNMPSGSHISGATSAMVPVNPCGATPTTVKSMALIADLAANERGVEPRVAPAVVAHDDDRHPRARVVLPRR